MLALVIVLSLASCTTAVKTSTESATALHDLVNLPVGSEYVGIEHHFTCRRTDGFTDEEPYYFGSGFASQTWIPRGSSKRVVKRVGMVFYQLGTACELNQCIHRDFDDRIFAGSFGDPSCAPDGVVIEG